MSQVQGEKCSLSDQSLKHGSGLRTMEAAVYPVRTLAHVTFPLPPSCCPVSRNPQSGFITVRFRPQGRVLEVYSMTAYLRSFVGGHPDGERNMEGMIEMIARDCAAALGVKVRVRAELILDTGRMALTVWGG